MEVNEAKISKLKDVHQRGEHKSGVYVYPDHLAATLHEAMEGLAAIGLVDHAVMKEFDDALLTKARPFSPAQLKALREREDVSQAVLARYLGVSVNTVSQWERGERRATGTAAKLLRLIEQHGLAYIR